MKVLVSDKVHSHLLSELEGLNFEVIYQPKITLEQVDEILPQLFGIVINSKVKMNASRIAKSKQLKFIARLGSGLEIIDLDAAEKQGVSVYNSPEGNRNAVAEQALGMLLCLSNNILRADREVRQKLWNREANRGIEIEGRAIGLIGFGNTGQAFARKLSGWTLDLSYYDPYLLDVPKEFSNIGLESIDQLKKLSNIISLHVPLTKETKGMIDYEFLKSCRPGTILINTSRGAVVKIKDLVLALKEGHISGACLDVFENEKPHSFTLEENQHYRELYAMENVVLTPHIAGWTDASLLKIAQVLVSKISKGFNS